jgi:soluble lytic murein transglycosylase-like protein
MTQGQAAFEPAVSTQFRSGVDRRRGDRRSGPRAQERRRGDRRRATALAGLLASAAAVVAHGRLHHYLPDLNIPGLQRVAPSVTSPPAPPTDDSPYERFIEEAAELYGVSANLVRAVIQTESNFNPRAVSRAGARGLMQLTPVTLREVKMTIDPFDPRANILAGTKYLGQLLARHDGNVPLALASYNAGPTAVRRHRGIPPFKETRGYVKKVQAELAELREAAEGTLAD